MTRTSASNPQPHCPPGGDSVVVQPFLRFAGRSLAALSTLFARRDAGAPLPGLVLRVGVAGHRKLPPDPGVEAMVQQVLAQLQQALHDAQQPYALGFENAAGLPAPECRLISQLAEGADQLVARAALALGYRLQCPLPAGRRAYATDLTLHAGGNPEPAEEMRRLSESADTVLELDGEADPNGRLTENTYENAALTMLEHSDVLLALVETGAAPLPGGTRWLIDEAARRSVPVIHIVVDQLGDSALEQGRRELRTPTPLSPPGSGWADRLVQSIVLPGGEVIRYPDSGRFEESFRRRLPVNEREWPLHGAASPWLAQIDQDYFRFWRWADHRANSYRDLYQGAYITIAFLALAAVAGALAGALNDTWSTGGKLAELAAIVSLLALWRRAHTCRWRQRWIGYRVLEQQLRNAAVLELVGRTIPAVTSPVEYEFQREGAWIQWYLRSVLRQASLPPGRLDPETVIGAGQLILERRIRHQIVYYNDAVSKNCRASHRLERISVASLVVTVVALVLYLGVKFTGGFGLPDAPFKLAALAAGVFCPALAATLAAIRAQGQFVQLETRYKGMVVHLTDLGQRLDAMLEKGAAPLLSLALAQYSKQAAAWMLEEVSQWRGLLFKNDIEIG